MKRAIIVAAGRGRRLGQETEAIPKCMVEVAGRPILHHQLAALKAAGVEETVIVRGYHGDRIAPGDFKVRFVDNPAWESNNILASLMHAAAEMEGGFVFSYSDIVFEPSAVQATIAAPGDLALVVDRCWSDTYEGRSLHPITEAELTLVRGSGEEARVLRVGKRLVAREEAAGEFIGLARFSSAAASSLLRVWEEALKRGLDAPYGAAPALRVAYLTDALNDMIQRGIGASPVFIDGRWREVDTEQDLARAHGAVASWSGRQPR